jgi:hypothetical protein
VNDRGETIDNKTMQWFGATVTSAGIDGPLVVSLKPIIITREKGKGAVLCRLPMSNSRLWESIRFPLKFANFKIKMPHMLTPLLISRSINQARRSGSVDKTEREISICFVLIANKRLDDAVTASVHRQSKFIGSD